MSARPFDRQGALDAVDAMIMQMLTLKRIIEAVDEPEQDTARSFCPDASDGRHAVVWTMAGPGMCSHCGAEFPRADAPGVSGGGGE